MAQAMFTSPMAAATPSSSGWLPAAPSSRGVLPVVTGVTKGDGVFQIGFTNGTPGATYSILFSTNVTAPLSNWAVIGTASQVVPGWWQFTDTKATDPVRFYRVRSP